MSSFQNSLTTHHPILTTIRLRQAFAKKKYNGWKGSVLLGLEMEVERMDDVTRKIL